jgi:hypothetical protein
MWENAEFWLSFIGRMNPKASVPLSSPSPCDCSRESSRSRPCWRKCDTRPVSMTACIWCFDWVWSWFPWCLCDWSGLLKYVRTLTVTPSRPFVTYFFTTSEEAPYVEMLSVRLYVLPSGRQYVTCAEVTEIKPAGCETTSFDALLFCSHPPPPALSPKYASYEPLLLANIVTCLSIPKLIWTEWVVDWRGVEGRTLKTETKHLRVAAWDSFRGLSLVIRLGSSCFLKIRHGTPALKFFFHWRYSPRWARPSWRFPGR